VSLFPTDLLDQARALLDAMRAKGLTLATAESCTGGLIAALLTEIPGSSEVFTHGYVTYANAAKTQMVGVDAALIAAHGAVSEQVARAMAEGALATSGASIAIAVTGIAGPSGGTREKPVGLVHLACARVGMPTLGMCHVFAGDRSAVRLQAISTALDLIERQWR
jgi:nicotinamide-nucleotide amidase